MRVRWLLQCEERPKSVDEVVERLLAIRGLNPDTFFQTDLSLLQRYLDIAGLEEAACLMVRHILQGHRILIVGDYDCDGITSVAQLVLFLQSLNYANLAVVIPTRAQGYGIPKEVVDKERDARLMVALDCGSLDVDVVRDARRRGMDVIVIDHHEVSGRRRAPASVVVNPKQPECPSAFKEFCSAGLTLLFLTKLRKILQQTHGHIPLDGRYLGIAALGTVADMVPLVEGNRILVIAGLKSLNGGKFVPFEVLRDVAGISRRPVGVAEVGYYLAPRLNAAGRMSNPRYAFEFLVAQNIREARKRAEELDRLNAVRQQEVNRVFREICQKAKEDFRGRRTLVMANPGWPSGVVGIVASKVQRELFYGPVALLSVDEKQGIARGSVRSVPGYDVHRALDQCADLLIRWGGHKMAAGVTVEIERLNAFKERFEAVASEADPSLFVRTERLDMELDMALVSEELFQALQLLEPHGVGNPAPIFLARGIRLTNHRRFGKNSNHLACQTDRGIPVVWWNGASSVARFNGTNPVDVAFRLDWDAFRRCPRVVLMDVVSSHGEDGGR